MSMAVAIAIAALTGNQLLFLALLYALRMEIREVIGGLTEVPESDLEPVRTGKHLHRAQSWGLD